MPIADEGADARPEPVGADQERAGDAFAICKARGHRCAVLIVAGDLADAVAYQPTVADDPQHLVVRVQGRVALGAAAACARLPFPVIDGEAFGEIAEFAIGPGEIAQARSARRNRFVEHLPDPRVDLMPYVQRVFETIGFAKISGSADDARKRLAYDEIFANQLALLLLRQSLTFRELVDRWLAQHHARPRTVATLRYSGAAFITR